LNFAKLGNRQPGFRFFRTCLLFVFQQAYLGNRCNRVRPHMVPRPLEGFSLYSPPPPFSQHCSVCDLLLGRSNLCFWGSIRVPRSKRVFTPPPPINFLSYTSDDGQSTFFVYHDHEHHLSPLVDCRERIAPLPSTLFFFALKCPRTIRGAL